MEMVSFPPRVPLHPIIIKKKKKVKSSTKGLTKWNLHDLESQESISEIIFDNFGQQYHQMKGAENGESQEKMEIM